MKIYIEKHLNFNTYPYHFLTKPRWYWHSYGILANTELIEKGQTNQVVGRDKEGEIGEKRCRETFLLSSFLPSIGLAIKR